MSAPLPREGVSKLPQPSHVTLGHVNILPLVIPSGGPANNRVFSHQIVFLPPLFSIPLIILSIPPPSTIATASNNKAMKYCYFLEL